jgi:hypothetical protein
VKRRRPYEATLRECRREIILKKLRTNSVALVCPAAFPHVPHLLYGVLREMDADLLERLDHDIAAAETIRWRSEPRI